MLRLMRVDLSIIIAAMKLKLSVLTADIIQHLYDADSKIYKSSI